MDIKFLTKVAEYVGETNSTMSHVYEKMNRLEKRAASEELFNQAKQLATIFSKNASGKPIETLEDILSAFANEIERLHQQKTAAVVEQGPTLRLGSVVDFGGKSNPKRSEADSKMAAILGL